MSNRRKSEKKKRKGTGGEKREREGRIGGERLGWGRGRYGERGDVLIARNRGGVRILAGCGRRGNLKKKVEQGREGKGQMEKTPKKKKVKMGGAKKTM